MHYREWWGSGRCAPLYPSLWYWNEMKHKQIWLLNSSLFSWLLLPCSILSCFFFPSREKSMEKRVRVLQDFQRNEFRCWQGWVCDLQHVRVLITDRHSNTQRWWYKPAKHASSNLVWQWLLYAFHFPFCFSSLIPTCEVTYCRCLQIYC